MKKLLLAAVALTAATTYASADLIDDPLHGACASGCPDTGAQTPISQGSSGIVNFGFAASPPGSTGTLELVFLVPNVAAGGGSDTPTALGGSFVLPTITGTGGLSNSAATLFTNGYGQSVNLFANNNVPSGKSATLQNFLGLSGQPNNPLGDATDHSGGILGQTTLLDPNATGFFVFTINAGSYGAPGLCNCDTPADQFAMNGVLPAGTAILGILNNNGTEVFTALSGQLQVQPADAVPGPIVGAGLPGLALGCLSMLALARRRINKWRNA